MNILLLEPFYTASHKQWADGLQAYSKHEIRLLSLAGRHWKWRMHGGAVTLAQAYKKLDYTPDLIIASDMLDVATFKALTNIQIPICLYFHENQLTYPWSPTDADVQQQRDNHYSFINYTSALVADFVLFNSQYHQASFLGALPDFLKQFPDHQPLASIATIEAKAAVLPLALDLKRFDVHKVDSKNETPIILWNHRWEYDKNPDEFFELLFRLKEESIAYQLVVLGESYRKMPPILKKAQTRLHDRILHFGYAKNFADYAHWLWRADIALTTSYQDFFGGSVVEAIYCACLPLLPYRLAYPEHIPTALQAKVLYQDKAAAYQLLQQYLTREIDASLPSQLASFVARYDWQEMIGLYDDKLEQMAQL